jgi:hypothetical protein
MFAAKSFCYYNLQNGRKQSCLEISGVQKLDGWFIVLPAYPAKLMISSLNLDKTGLALLIGI